MSVETIFIHDFLTLTLGVHHVDTMSTIHELPEHYCSGFCKRNQGGHYIFKYYTLPVCLHIICDEELRYRIRQKDYSCPTCQRPWKNNDCFKWDISYVN